MALDPSISLGVRPLQLADPLAQYGQVAAIQNAQNQNQLAQFQLGAAQRSEQTKNMLADAYKESINPEGKIDYSKLTGLLAARGGGELLPGIQKTQQEILKEQGLIEKTGLEVSDLKIKQRIGQANRAVSDIASLSTPEEAVASIDKNLKDGNIDLEKANMLKGKLAQAPSFNTWQKDSQFPLGICN